MELNLEHKFLADENEREEAKIHFLKLFGEGETKALRITVGPYKDASIEEKLSQYLDFKIGIDDYKISEHGLFSKKRTSTYTTKLITISESSMNNLANLFYDVILAFDVKVDIDVAQQA